MKTARKGYIATSLVAIVVLGFVTLTIGITLSEHARNLLKIRRMQNYYLTESAVDIAKSVIAGRFQDRQLFVEFDNGVPVSSSPVYSGDAAVDFSEARTKVEELVLQENSKIIGFYMDISIQDKSPSELQLHVLDKTGALFDMDEYTIGELAPIEFGVTVKLQGIELYTSFAISGIEFHLLSADDYTHQLTVGLSTAHMSVETTEFEYR